MNYVTKLFSSSFKLLNLVLHLIVADDIEEKFLIICTIKQSESNAGIAESTRSSDTVQVAFVVRDKDIIFTLRRDIEIDD